MVDFSFSDAWWKLSIENLRLEAGLENWRQIYRWPGCCKMKWKSRGTHTPRTRVVGELGYGGRVASELQRDLRWSRRIAKWTRRTGSVSYRTDVRTGCGLCRCLCCAVLLSIASPSQLSECIARPVQSARRQCHSNQLPPLPRRLIGATSHHTDDCTLPRNTWIIAFYSPLAGGQPCRRIRTQFFVSERPSRIALLTLFYQLFLLGQGAVHQLSRSKDS